MSEEITSTSKADSIRNKARSSITIKFIIIGLILLLTQIPLTMIRVLRRERESRSSEAKSEIASQWGGSQNVIGPILNIPLQRNVIQEITGKDNTVKTETIRETENLQIAPASLTISGTMTPEIRYRGIYEVLLYRSSLTITGSIPAVGEFLREREEWEPLCAQARLVLGIQDIKGIVSIDFKIDGETQKVIPGSNPGNRYTGISVPIPALTRETKEIPFEVHLELNGCERLFFYPVGRRSLWNPSGPRRVSRVDSSP